MLIPLLIVVWSSRISTGSYCQISSCSTQAPMLAVGIASETYFFLPISYVVLQPLGEATVWTLSWLMTYFPVIVS